MTAAIAQERSGRSRPTSTPRLSHNERVARGRQARSDVPRSSHAGWTPPADRPDPVGLLEEQAASRVPELVPIRHGRMMASPLAFFRGAAYLMASDLAGTPRSGIRAQLCGDAHLSNFGGFASPERAFLFDLNDFDETLPGPWEWDVKRLTASFTVTGRHRGFPAKRCRELAQIAARSYRDAMLSLAGMTEREVWYTMVDASELEQAVRSQGSSRQVKRLRKLLAKAHRKDSSRAFEKLTANVDGTARIIADHPLIVPIEDLLPDTEARQVEDWVQGLVKTYRATLQSHHRQLLDRYDYAHLARKVVGVGSVGTRAWVVLFVGREQNEPLFLQCKEAQASALEPFAGGSEYGNMGRRVVEGQRLMQAASDIFLGWLRTTALDGEVRDFYVRQLWDWKGSADPERILPSSFDIYAQLCGRVLARAHARSGDRVAIASYLGRSDGFDRAIATFSDAYADQNERDYDAFVAAIKSGRLTAARTL
jgi:uncharacterized protein (DUF2252 family)